MLITAHKGGGTNIGSVSRLKNLEDYIKEGNFGPKSIFTISALAGITRKLIRLSYKLTSSSSQIEEKISDCNEILFDIELRHVNLIEELFGFSKKEYHKVPVNEFKSDLAVLREIVNISLYPENWSNHASKLGISIDNCNDQHSFLNASILKFGEIFSSKIVSHYFNFVGIDNIWVDSRDLVYTKVPLNGDYTHAPVDLDPTIIALRNRFNNLFNETNMIIFTGYNGRDIDTGRDTNLGLNSSDVSTMLTAKAGEAKLVGYWKDVPGVFTDDPHKNRNAKFLPKITIQDYIDLFDKLGGGPVSKEAALLALTYQIDFEVRSIDDPHGPYTLVSSK